MVLESPGAYRRAFKKLTRRVRKGQYEAINTWEDSKRTHTPHHWLYSAHVVTEIVLVHYVVYVMNGLDRCFFDQRESQQHGDDCGYSYISLGRLHPYGSGSGSSSGSGRRRTRRGLSDSPTAPTTPTSASDNASDATLTDSELPLARDSTLLVQNGMCELLYI
ncbi:unnamed protein product, partial [Brenthis ino]